MKKLITYLKALWRRGLDSQRKEVGVISEEGAIEHPLSTYSAPFGTCWQPSGKLHSVVRCAAMLVMLFTLGSGNVWGADETLTITGASSGHNAPWGTSYGSSTGSSTTSASHSISLSWTNVGRMNTGIQIKANTSNHFRSTSYPSTNNIIKSIKITMKTNTANLYGSTDGSNWTSISYTSGTAKDVEASGYKYFKVSATSSYCVLTSIVVTYTSASGYSITYHCNGATSGCPSNASGQSALPNPLPTPAKTGFTFGGWYTDAALTSAASAGATLSANADLYAKWTCNVTLNRNGATETINNIVEGTALDDIDGTGAQGGCSAWTFVGWSKTQRVAQNVSTPMTLVTEVDGAGPYYAVYSHTEGGGGSSTVTDVITAADLEATGTSYVAFEDVAGSSSDAVYAGQSAKNGSDIQLRGTSPAGIVSTTSGGTIKSVVIEWSSSATASRTVDVYGKSSAYSTAADLYNASTDGDKVGSITYTSSSNYQTTYNFSSDYEYVGIRMTSSATRIASVSITWTTSGGGTTYYSTTATCCTDPGLNYGTASVTKTFGNGTFKNTLTNSHSVSVTYESSNTDVATVASDGTVTIKGAGNATITARFAGNSTYCADEASYTLTVNKASISPTLTYTPNSVAVGENTSAPTVGANPGSGGVTYAITSATPAGCATIDAGTGVVSGVAVGSVTVTATVAATANYNGGTATATVTINAAAYFPNNKTVFIQGESSSAWDASACVKAWFNASGAGGAAQTTYWLFDATDGDAGKKLYATIVPASGDLNQVTLQRFTSNCSDFWNNNGTLTKASDGGSNTFRSTGSGTSNVAWNGSGMTLDLKGDPNSWGSSLGTFADQGNGVWTATYNNYAPADAAGESQEFKISTNYNGWIGNTGSNNNATLDGMHVGSTYNITATLDVKDHSLTMSKTFVKGTVHFDLQGHGSAISDLTNVAAGSKISAPSPAPSVTGWDFGGWYKEAGCTNAWNFASDEVNETVTLYAKWTAHEYTITKTFSNVTNASLPASFTYTGATTTALNSSFTVDGTNFFLPSSITVTMGGSPLTAGTHYTYDNSNGAFTFSAVISGDIVITATATAKLKSIAITTPPTTRKYLVGESFSSTGAVVTATMGDGSTKAVTASATWTPAGALSAGTGQTVTATYTEAGIEKTTTTTIDVYSVTVNKVNMSGTAIADAGVTASCSGRTLSQSVSTTNYKFNSWVVTAGGVSVSTNTITGTPTGNVTINAKFHDPITVTWKVGSGAASGGTGEVKYGTKVSSLPSDPTDDALASCGTNKFMGWSKSELKGTGHDAPADLFTSTSDAGCAALTENTTYRAVFANVVGASGYEYIGDAGLLEEDETYIFVSSKSTGSAYALKSSDLPNNNTAGVKGTAVSVTVATGIKIATTNTDLEFTCSSHNSESEEDVLVIGSTANTLRINGNGIGYGTARAYYDNTGLWGWNNSVNKFYDVYYNSTSEKFEAKESADTRVYAYKKLTSTTSDYQTGCCSAPGTPLSITSANSVATGGTVSLTSTGGNGGTVTWSVVNGTGTATVAGTTLTAGSIGTVTVKAHQDANTVLGTEYCAQDAEQAFTVVSSTVNVTSVSVDPTSKAILVGETFTITPTVLPANATDKSVSWTSGTPAKATVNSSGVVTGVAAGTSTITCTTTDGSFTATCATTVYSASVTSIVDEDGTDISASGVSAEVSGRTLTASEGSTNYKFKTWKYGTASGTSISSATSLSTSLTGTPNGNVTLIAEFYKPVTVAWTKGGTTYSTGGPTTSVKRGTQWKDLTIPTAPGDATLGACANKFMGWSNCSDLIGTGHSAPGVLFTSVTGITTEITADIEFKAVFATDNKSTWTLDYSEESALSSSTAWSYGNGLSYTASDGGTWVVKANKSSGMQINAGKNSSIKIPDCSGDITSIVVTGAAKTVRFSQSDYDGSSFGVIEVTGSDANTQTLDFAGKSLTAGYIVPFTNANQITKIVVNYGSTSDYVTQCDPNQVKVTYDANGGSTTCAGGTHDKRNDYTICSSAPTKDYYSFAGWLCSADSKTYAASATIDDAVIDADFSLTAQWTPVNYYITYNLHDGTTAGGNPTTYNVETATFDLADGTYGHNRFEGWYRTYNDGTGAYSDQVTSIPLGSHGDITLHAKWTTRHEIIFDADGTLTTIYRADDENMEDAVAGQGSVPSDPSAPTNCNTKVFVGWSESEIDDETNTRPSDLMKPAEGKVDEDKHYYAVWALRAGSPAPATYAGTGTFVKVTSLSEIDVDTYYVLRGIKDASTIKVLKNTVSSGKMGTADDPVSENVITNPGVAIVWKLGGTKDAYTLYNQSASKYVEITANSTGGYALNSSATTSYTLTIEEGHGFFFKSNHASANSRGISIYDASEFRSYGLANAKNLELYKLPAYTYSAYSTSCCETKVNLTHNSPEHGTVEFNKSRIGTCNSDKNVALIITPDAGYKLTAWTVNTASGYADAKTTSPAVVTTNNNSAAQNITLTFAQDANKNYDVTATFGLMTVESWTWTHNSAALPDPFNLYVGQTARFDVAYTPAGVDNSKKTYTRTKEDAYINWSGAQQATYSTISGKASTGENTTPVTFTHGDGPTTTVNVKVLPLPAVHFGDIVHNVSFDDVVATLSDNTLSPTKTTPTHADFDGSTANTCEEQHLHLVGWIREDWPALVTYLNGGAQPSTSDITTAGDDASGNAYFFAPGASINTQTFNGVTFYAVWAKVE